MSALRHAGWKALRQHPQTPGSWQRGHSLLWISLPDWHQSPDGCEWGGGKTWKWLHGWATMLGISQVTWLPYSFIYWLPK